MTDNDIIKTYEDKVNLIGSMTSVYLDEEDGLDLYEVMSNTLDLINRKKAEIENCYEFIERLKEARNIWDDKCKKKQTEIEFLQSSKNLHEAEFESLKTELELAKAFHKEAVAERDLLNVQLKGAKTEIERLAKGCGIITEEDENWYPSPLKTPEEIKAEAVKEFEERAIKNICEKVYAPTPVQSCIVEKCNQVIIETAKEMEGEG